MALPTLPATLTVVINDEPITAKARPNGKKDNIFYRGSVLVPETFEDIEDVKKVLAGVTASYEGTALKAGEVHLSAPQKYRKDHEKAGQIVPGTGNNWSVTHSMSIRLQADGEENDRGYTLMVTCTYIGRQRRPNDQLGFAFKIQAIPQSAGNGYGGLEGTEGLTSLIGKLVTA